MSYNYDESKETLIPITQLADNLGYKPKKKDFNPSNFRSYRKSI